MDRLAATSFRWLQLLVGGLALQVLFQVWDPGLTESRQLIVVLVANAAVAAFLLANLRLPGMLLAGLGLAANVLVIALNSGMPVSASAAEQVGRPIDETSAGLKHERLTDESTAPWLADIVPIPVLNEVISPGDVLLAAGIGWFVYRRTRSGDGELPVDGVKQGARRRGRHVVVDDRRADQRRAAPSAVEEDRSHEN